jgi:hypothetical protein
MLYRTARCCKSQIENAAQSEQHFEPLPDRSSAGLLTAHPDAVVRVFVALTIRLSRQLNLRSMPTLLSTRAESSHGTAAGKAENTALEAP